MMLVSANTKFWVPKAIVPDGKGGVYVGFAPNKGGIIKYRFTGTSLEPEWSAKIGSVRGLALLPDARLYATKAESKVQEIAPDGSVISTWGTPVDKKNQRFAGPTGIAVDEQGHIYVVESSSWGGGARGGHCVQKFTKDCEFILTWGEKGTGPGQLNMPTYLALDSSGRVFVADSYNSRVQIFDPDGSFVAAWGSHGMEEGLLNCPQGIALDAEDNVYLADTYNNRIQKFTADGKFLAKWSKCGTDECQFFLPCGIAVDNNGTVFVADSMNHKIHAFRDNT